ncbi:MAG: ABATE domain-containing protein [Chloroflexi bacterium]|nr:ABATE domain-containing protein [Chloroflexota bacterium]
MPQIEFGHPTDHGHEVPLDGAFDFINTLHYDDGFAVDDMTDDSDVAAWLGTHGMLHEQNGKRVEQCTDGLERAREVRQALRAVVDATAEGRTPDPDAVAILNKVLGSRIVPMLEVTPEGVRTGHRHLGDAVDSALALLVEPVVRELAGGRPERFRVCANEDCRWTFFDSSPTGRRRWCDMRTCGNRAKVARHRARSKATTAATARPAVPIS